MLHRSRWTPAGGATAVCQRQRDPPGCPAPGFRCTTTTSLHKPSRGINKTACPFATRSMHTPRQKQWLHRPVSFRSLLAARFSVLCPLPPGLPVSLIMSLHTSTSTYSAGRHGAPRVSLPLSACVVCHVLTFIRVPRLGADTLKPHVVEEVDNLWLLVSLCRLRQHLLQFRYCVSISLP